MCELLLLGVLADDDGVRIVSSGPRKACACQPLGYVVSLWILSMTASVVGVEV